jgi:hypothetical protein
MIAQGLYMKELEQTLFATQHTQQTIHLSSFIALPVALLVMPCMSGSGGEVLSLGLKATSLALHGVLD